MKIEFTDYAMLLIFWCVIISLLATNPYVKIGFSMAELVIVLIVTIIKQTELLKEEMEAEDDDDN